MPQIPQYESRVSPQGFGTGRGSTPSDFGGQTAQAVGQLGEVVSRLGEHMSKVRDAGLLAKSTAKSQQALQEYSFQLQNGSTDGEGNYLPPPDPREHEKLFDDRAKQINEEAKAELGEGQLYAEYEASFQRTYGSERLTLRKANIDLQKNQALSDLTVGMDSLATVASQGDPRSRAEAIARAEESVDTFVAAGLIDPVKGVAQKKSFNRLVDVADLRRDLRDPTTALQNLMGGKAYPNLDPAERQQWINTAITAVDKEAREKRAEQVRQDKEAEKAEKAFQSETAKTGAELEASGKLSVQWVRANRDNLDETDYRALLKSASGEGEGGTNKRVYSDLRLRRARGEDVSDEATAAYQDGSITKTDLNGLTGKGAEDGPRKNQWHKDGEKFLGTVVADSDINPNPAIKALKAELLDRWGEWTDAHPDATPDQARKEYRALADEARMVDTDKLTIGLPMPRYSSGGRASLTPQTVVRAAMDTRAAFQSGEIDAAEYKRQGRILKQWTDAMRFKTPPAEGNTNVR